MIRKETWKIGVSADAVESIAASEKPDSVYDTNTSELSFNVNVITERGFRLVHDTKRVITTIEAAATNTTSTIHEAEEFRTEEEMETRINKLGLDWDPDEPSPDDDTETP